MKPNDESDNARAISRRTALAFGAAVAATPLLPPIAGAAQSKVSHSTEAQGAETMTFVTTKDGTEIFYKDWGEGRPGLIIEIKAVAAANK